MAHWQVYAAVFHRKMIKKPAICSGLNIQCIQITGQGVNFLRETAHLWHGRKTKFRKPGCFAGKNYF
ncbi:hypothetical protein CKF42_01460 [Pantoea sp. ARC270]|nr:hypothetical protein CKF42_01460 [Pantoea sp. ARC270]